jgi:hypothetical protein
MVQAICVFLCTILQAMYLCGTRQEQARSAAGTG